MKRYTIILILSLLWSCTSEHVENAKFELSHVGLKQICFAESINQFDGIWINNKDNDPVLEFIGCNGTDYDNFFQFAHRGIDFSIMTWPDKTVWPIQFTTVWNEEITLTCPEKDGFKEERVLENGAHLNIEIVNPNDVSLKIISKDEKSRLSYRFRFFTPDK